LKLIKVIQTYIGNEYSTHFKINFPKYAHQTIRHVKIAKSSKPIFTAFEGGKIFLFDPVVHHSR